MAAHLLLGEAAPAIPVIVWVLRGVAMDATTIASWLVVLGLCILAEHIVRAFFGTITGPIGWIPWANKVVAAPLHKIEQKLTNALGNAEHKIDLKIATAWHALGDEVRWIGHEIQANAGVLYAMATLLVNPLSIPAWKTLYKAVTVPLENQWNAIRHAGHGYIGAAIHAGTRPLTIGLHGLERFVHSRVRALEHAIEVTLPRDIAALRHRDKVLTDFYSKLFAKVKGIENRFATTAFLGAVAVALTGMGLGFLRCNSFGRLGRRIGCGGFAFLEELLFVGSAYLVVVDPVKIAHAAVDAEGFMEKIIREVAD